MTLDVIAVNVAAVATIVWIVWFFWLSEKEGTRAALGVTGIQEVFVRVKGGYDPDVIVLDAGRPARLHFNRQETAACSEMVVFPDFDISRELPANETVTIDLEALKAGQYDFACQMGMLKGMIVAVDERDVADGGLPAPLEG